MVGGDQRRKLKDTRPRGRPRSDTRLEEVLACAAAMFSAKGYAATTLEDIAAQLDMTRAGLYYYADSKEDLLTQCYRWTHQRFMQQLDTALEGGTGRDALSRFFMLYAEAICDDASRCFLSSENHYLRPGLEKEVSLRIHEIIEIVATLLERGVSDGSLVVTDPKYAITALFGAFNALQSLVRPRGPSPRQAGERLLKIILEGLIPARAGN
jgi:AcrR family transcriptional regulator